MKQRRAQRWEESWLRLRRSRHDRCSLRCRFVIWQIWGQARSEEDFGEEKLLNWIWVSHDSSCHTHIHCSNVTSEGIQEDSALRASSHSLITIILFYLMQKASRSREIPFQNVPNIECHEGHSFPGFYYTVLRPASLFSALDVDRLLALFFQNIFQHVRNCLTTLCLRLPSLLVIG